MEFLLIIVILLLALCSLLYIAMLFVRDLTSGKSTKLTKGFEAKLSVVPIERQKSEVSAENTNSTNGSRDD